MMHNGREWGVADVLSAAELADKLVNHSWCCCTGFRLGGYLFLNDATGGDGAAEFGVVRESDLAQVESITFSWCDYNKALEYILQAVAGQFTEVYAHVNAKAIKTPQEHGTCGHCA